MGTPKTGAEDYFQIGFTSGAGSIAQETCTLVQSSIFNRKFDLQTKKAETKREAEFRLLIFLTMCGTESVSIYVNNTKIKDKEALIFLRETP